MYGAVIIPASVALSWMVSSDALVLLGNGFGQGRLLFIGPLALVVLLSILAVNLLHHPAVSSVETGMNTLSSGVHLAILSLSLASYFSLVLLLPTGMLVSAGFVFNETFVYWFPNFAFSFLLLGIILLVHLAGERFALGLQPFFIGITVACISVLCLAGLAVPRETEQVVNEPQTSISLSLLLSPFLLVLGYDRQETAAARDSRPTFRMTLVLYFIFAVLWGYVSLSHVGPERLAQSTVPHITTGRAILGQTGRIIMGMAVISGTCGLVNGLFLLCIRVARQLFGPLLSRGAATSRKGYRQRILPLVFTVLIAVCMATGVAGSEQLETWIYGALLLWIVTIAVRCLIAEKKIRRTIAGFPRYYRLLSAVFCAAALSLATMHPDGDRLFTFCFLALGVGMALSCMLMWLGRKTFIKTHST